MEPQQKDLKSLLNINTDKLFLDKLTCYCEKINIYLKDLKQIAPNFVNKNITDFTNSFYLKDFNIYKNNNNNDYKIKYYDTLKNQISIIKLSLIKMKHENEFELLNKYENGKEFICSTELSLVKNSIIDSKDKYESLIDAGINKIKNIKKIYDNYDPKIKKESSSFDEETFEDNLKNLYKKNSKRISKFKAIYNCGGVLLVYFFSITFIFSTIGLFTTVILVFFQ